MAKDAREIFDAQNLSDDELREVIREQLREAPEVDEGWIEVEVDAGHVRLSGQLGTDGEVRLAEKLVAELVGADRHTSELVVGAQHREERPLDPDADPAGEADDQAGEERRPQSDTAAHLQKDLEAETYGTRDMQQAIQEGATYEPPDRPRPDGYDSGENH
jgi:hypothetical protein